MAIEKRIKVGNSDIGTTGNVKGGLTSSEGGQHPFMPAASSYKNSGKGGGKRSGGVSSDAGKGGKHPFLPDGNASGLRKRGKK